MSIITIDNPISEIQSLPLTQSIKIRVKGLVEVLQLKASIILFRLQDDKLLNLAEPYAYTLGYIKETFDIVDINITSSIDLNGDTLITCLPCKPLNPSSKYAIYVAKTLSSPFINLQKTVSKSNSSIEVELLNNPTYTEVYTLVCQSTPYITTESNIVKFQLSSNAGIENYILDLKTSKNKINLTNLKISFPDTVFATGETFVLTLNAQQSVTEDLIAVFNTVMSTTIQPIAQTLASTQISNTDLLNYMQTAQNVAATPTLLKPAPTYLEGNVFTLDNLGLTKDQIDINSLSYTIRDAFGNYLLRNMSLNDTTLSYVLHVYWDSFEERPIFELVYSDGTTQDPTSTPALITVDLTHW